MHRFRVFVSYANEDREKAVKLVEALERIDLEPLWDQNIGGGSAFPGEIKGLIAHSHIFLPLITAQSEKSPWVHQETGYAIALKIPVLPIVLAAEGNKPSVLISDIQAIEVDEGFKDLNILERHVEQLVVPLPPRPTSLTDIAQWPEKRTELLAKYADREIRSGNYGKIRQKAAYSSFYIPDDIEKDRRSRWKELDGETPRSDYYHYLLSEERRALGQHADQEGCKLIIYPMMRSPYSGKNATKVRLEQLVNFLKSAPDDKVEVVFSRSAMKNNLTIVGDWFLATSHYPGRQGYRHTIFNFHAPTVLRRLRQFDEEFGRLLAQQRVEFKGGSSRMNAIAKIEEFVDAHLGDE